MEVLAISSLGLALSSPAQAGEQANVPNFVLEDLDGKKVSLADLRANGPVVIDFWATWCKPCTRSMPHLDELGKKYAKDGLSVVAISIDETRSLAKVKSYVQTHDYEFKVLLDSNQRVLRQLQGTGVPYVVVVSADGQLIYSHSGYREGDEDALAKVVAEAMGGAPASSSDAAPAKDAAPAATETPVPAGASDAGTPPAGDGTAESETGSPATGGDR
jgi:thiol-disulfide isomerase/thioredoxin